MTAPPRQRLFDRFAPIVIGLVVLPAVGVVGYRWIEGWSFLDALYMTVTTLATVGYGEVHPLSTGGRVFTIGLIVCGGALAAYALTQLAQVFYSGEWRRHWENQKRARMLAELSNHIIVCGYGRVGRNVIKELQAEGLPFVVIDLNPEKVARAQETGALVVQGDAAHESKLKEAGIERARGLVAAARSDAENVFIVLTARSLRPDLSIVARADVEESEPKLLRAGANRVILPYHITGRRLVTMLVRPDVADFLDEVSHTSGMELLLEQIQVAADSALAGQTLAHAQSRYQFDVTVLACKSAQGKWNSRPQGATVVEPQCQLIALGTQEHLQRLTELARGGG
ncbi:MAG: potassium channel protein [Verrucomicrobia bacterium]|nr:potassium channel protein [Verrucomicrobiota bacterium]